MEHAGSFAITAEGEENECAVFVQGTVAGAATSVGNTVLMQQQGIDVTPLVQSAEQLRTQPAAGGLFAFPAPAPGLPAHAMVMR